MERHKIVSVDDPLFNRVWEIYVTSFPLSEQRTLEHQITAFTSSDYHLICYLDRGDCVGFIGMWLFDEYSYIEHFAIDPSLRNGGWGSKILMDFITDVARPIILEIDDLTDDISRRREQFYMRLGFVYNPYKHPLHIYQPEYHTDALLRIMTYPAPIDQECYDRFNAYMHAEVMKR